MLPQNRGEPMGAPAIFEKQIEIKFLHPASTLESRIQAQIIPYATAHLLQFQDRLTARVQHPLPPDDDSNHASCE
ncbi:MAG: hypothetical protein P8X74_07145 [Reinekea sp.]